MSKYVVGYLDNDKMNVIYEGNFQECIGIYIKHKASYRDKGKFIYVFREKLKC